MAHFTHILQRDASVGEEGTATTQVRLPGIGLIGADTLLCGPTGIFLVTALQVRTFWNIVK
jgi:hypothetical protein